MLPESGLPLVWLRSTLPGLLEAQQGGGYWKELFPRRISVDFWSHYFMEVTRICYAWEGWEWGKLLLLVIEAQRICRFRVFSLSGFICPNVPISDHRIPLLSLQVSLPWQDAWHILRFNCHYDFVPAYLPSSSRVEGLFHSCHGELFNFLVYKY